MSNEQTLSSVNIRVFPTTKRTNMDPQSRLMTEYNLTSIINRLVDKDSFVITSDLKDPMFYFNIHGYIFSVSNEDNSICGVKKILEKFSNITESDIITAIINIKFDIGTETGSVSPILKTWAQLQGDDDATQCYDGVKFELLSETTSLLNVPDQTKYYRLNILECISFSDITDDTFSEGEITSTSGKYIKHNGKYFRIYPDSKIKFETNKEGTNRSIHIDDGVL